ncbi:RNA polymerase, sigma 54 subunit, RpoN/SigL [Bryocella elongata]|uniref:RNA polymerase, sigma 54 subunit, RpoN/SigL n=1 Tax=Bryocella elongata TaxID=863522 RepID=A0A1H5ZBR3_9BACT|nr:RNA polymerase factor sigma-54 [Bryocella elongata]SEG32796.1 RNA polymerase, sigma 54 subunit, RpoN/SigL [Bryocella elongata]
MLQPRLNVKLSQRQVLTPGLVQMVGVLALTKLELKDMINGELIENPVLEEIDETSETLDERSGKEGDLERSVAEISAESERPEKDPFDEIDFGSYFQDFLDPGYRTAGTLEDYDKPSFEHFLSAPSTLTDHLTWQLGSMSISRALRQAADIILGNLNEDGYLTATDEEIAESLSGELSIEDGLALIAQAREVVAQLDPVGIGARDLRECLSMQIRAQQREARHAEERATLGEEQAEHLLSVLELASTIIDQHLALLQKRDMRELNRLCRQPAEVVNEAVDVIRRLDPRPGQRYNQSATRLIEPDVAFVRRDDEWVVVMNEEDMPALRLNNSYRKMLREKSVERDVREYVKERYKSAIQLLRNIEQRKNTIVRTCESIVRRQQEFLERGVEGLRPMMIKEVAEEIGVHPSTVSRAVANKYVHTTQGVYELRFFFSEAVNGPEGGDLPLPLLKRKVKKLIEEEDPRKPWTDDYLAAELQRQGIKVTRRTVAKYREDMQIPSTHQRRQR